MDAYYSAEQKITQQCNLILNTDTDFWEIRNRAMLQLTAIMTNYNENGGTTSQTSINFTNFFKQLKEPLKSMLLDLRSQQVRDTCAFLIKLSEVVPDQMKIFMRDIFPIIQEALRVPNKVISTYVDDCIQKLIKNSTFKSCIPILISELRDNKAKIVREHCIDYINEILIQWEITDKDGDMLAEVIRVGLQDASIRVREVARLAYLNLFGLYPKKIDRIRSSLPATVAGRLVKAEEAYTKAKLNATSKIAAPRSPSSNKSSPSMRLSPSSLKPQSSFSMINPPDSDIIISSALPIISPRGVATEIGFRARRQSLEEESVKKIQAIFRGSLVRRLSGNGLPLTPPISPQKQYNPVEQAPASIIPDIRRPSLSARSDSLNSKNSSPDKSSRFSHDSTLALDMLNLDDNKSINSHQTTSSHGMSSDGSHLTIGMTVEVKGRDIPTYGIVRYIGRTNFNPDGYWVGVHLAGPYGKNDGSVKGVKYFICEENCGLFVRPQTVYPLNFSEFKPQSQPASTQPSPAKKPSSSNELQADKKNTATRTSQLCDLSKLKISMTMELLYQQLECIERIERAELQSSTKTDSSSSRSSGSNGVVTDEERTLMTLATKERELWDIYAEKLMKLK